MDLSDIITRVLRNLGRRAGYRPLADVERFAMDANRVPAAERQQTDLHRLFYENTGLLVHKWRNYLPMYHRHLARFRGLPLRLLEIGVSQGGSLALWRRYFGSEAIIFGIDIDPRCAVLDGRDGQVRIGSQADRVFLGNVVSEMGGLDVVIDDGSHVASHQQASLKALLPRLSAEGVYICEDLHTSYWRGRYEGGYRRRSSFIEIAKKAIDDIHGDFHRHGEGIEGASRSIDGIHFYNSIVVLEKRPQPAPAHIRVGVKQL